MTAPSANQDLRRYLRALARQEHQRLLEVRFRRPGGMGRRFLRAGDVDAAAELIGRLGHRVDVYVGVLGRDRRAGGRDAVSGGRTVFVEVDSVSADRLLERAPAPPSMVVASGTPGHLHAYWLLSERATGERIQEANRKLCHRVGGDTVTVDFTRILRPPQTYNHKHAERRPVRLLTIDENRVYDLAALTRGLEDPQAVETPKPLKVRVGSAYRAARSAGDLLHGQLREISTADYVRVLTGREPNSEGKINCPFHDDRTPSLQLYGDGTFCCFGCRRGGTIYDFAGALWRMNTKGREFVELRNRLADVFGAAPAGAAAGRAIGERPDHWRAEYRDQGVGR